VTATRALLLAIFAFGVDSAINLADVVGPALTGQVIAAGGFEVAGPWSGLLGVAALALAWRALPRPQPMLAA
jgi:hypothetical protein